MIPFSLSETTSLYPTGSIFKNIDSIYRHHYYSVLSHYHFSPLVSYQFLNSTLLPIWPTLKFSSQNGPLRKTVSSITSFSMPHPHLFLLRWASNISHFLSFFPLHTSYSAPKRLVSFPSSNIQSIISPQSPFTLSSAFFASSPRYLLVSLWLSSTFLFKCHCFREALLDCALKGVQFPKFPIPFFTFSAALSSLLLTCIHVGASLSARA